MTGDSPGFTLGVVLLASLALVAPVAGATGPALVGGTGAPVADAGSTVGPPSIGPGATGSAAPDNATNHSDPYPKVQDGLVDGESGVAPESAGPDRVTVVVETSEGAADAVARAANSHGSVTRRHGTLVEVRIPRRAVPKLADRPDVEYVRRPMKLQPVGDLDRATVAQRVEAADGAVRTGDAGSLTAAGYGSVTSEGVSVIDADSAQSAGYAGEGVTVAVIDYGFDASNPEISGQVVQTVDCTGSGCSAGSVGGDSSHGTAAAEIVLDVAPEANLVLIKAQTYMQLISAANWIDANGDVDVASMSLGMLGGVPLDGTSRLDGEIDDSVDSGTLWSVSAGNQASGDHWNGEWQDPDGNGWHNFSGPDEGLTVTGDTTVTLQWNDWYGSDQDYDLYLYDEAGNVVAKSTQSQSGSQYPKEKIDCTAACSAGETYHLAIRRSSASGNADFDMFFATQSSPEYASAGRSITVPATAEKATAVGAVYYGNQQLESFSSRGPTKDGRTKPDLVAPDGVETSAYPGHFFGTSAAAPHAAGAAALVIDGDESLSATETESRLRQTATPVTGGEPDNLAGWGLVDVDAAIRPAAPSDTTIVPDAIDESNQNAVTVRVTLPEKPQGGDVIVRLTGPDGNAVTGRASADTGDTTTEVTVDASSLADGAVTATAKVEDGLDRTNAGGFTAQSQSVTKSVSAFTVSDYRASTPGGTNLTVQFDASEPVSTVQVSVNEAEDGKVATLREGDFSATDGTYTATVDLGRDGTFTVRLDSVTDGDGNDAADGQSAVVEINTSDGGSGDDGSGDDGSGDDGSDDDGSDDDGSGDDGSGDDDSTDAPDRPVTVGLSPSSQAIPPGGSTTVYVTLNETRKGLLAYDLEVRLNDTSVATVSKVETVTGAGLRSTKVTDGGAVADVSVINEGITGNESDVRFVRITIEGRSAGSVSLSPSVTDISNRDNAPYAVTGVTDATITVADGASSGGVDVNGDGNESTNVDDDPNHEDVNGDERFSILDVQVLYAALDDPDSGVKGDLTRFDFNDDEEVNIVDVQRLFFEYTSE